MEKVIEDIQRQVWEQLTILAEQIKEKLRAQVQFVLKGNKKIATGTLWKSIDGEIERKANELIITIFSNTNYAEWVHNGTPPHFPPVYKIRDWVRLKHLAGSYSVKTKRRLHNRMDQYWEDTELAYKIAWKIYRKGTKGLKFFDIALKQLTPWIDREVANFKPTFD